MSDFSISVMSVKLPFSEKESKYDKFLLMLYFRFNEWNKIKIKFIDLYIKEMFIYNTEMFLFSFK